MNELPLRERLFVLLLVLLLSFFAGLSYIHDSSESYPLTIALHVSGAVEKPGIHTFSEESTLQDLMLQTGVKENANMSGFKKKIINMSQEEIVVPEKGYKIVYLQGAVKKRGACRVLEEARIKDLKDLGVLKEEADHHWMKRKRLLKNQEEVIVPSTNQK